MAKRDWGVFTVDGMARVFDIDVFVDLKDHERAKVSNFPVERGAFASYNKVLEPFKVPVRLAVGSGEDRRAAFLAELHRRLKDTTQLLAVVTPEFVYQPVTLTGFSFARAATNGKAMIIAELDFEEIRQVDPLYVTVAIPPSKAKKSGSVSKANVGKQNPDVPDKAFKDLTPQQAAALAVELTGG